MWIWGLMVVVLVIIGISWLLTSIMLYPNTHTREETLASEVASGYLDPVLYQQLPKEDVSIHSPFGYALRALYIPIEREEKVVIISHGITQNAIRSLRYMMPFYQRGYSVLLIEHRNHGRSGGTNTSYGYYEKDDLKAWVDWLYQRPNSLKTIGIHGESMGAAIAILHTARDSRIAFVVADCPFARAADEFAYRLKEEYHLPRYPLIPMADFVCKLRAGFLFSKVAPLDEISGIHTPILFIHGAEDTYIPSEDSRALFAAKPGIKELWIAQGSEHANSMIDYPELYDSHVRQFLERIGAYRSS